MINLKENKSIANKKIHQFLIEPIVQNEQFKYGNPTLSYTNDIAFLHSHCIYGIGKFCKYNICMCHFEWASPLLDVSS